MAGKKRVGKVGACDAGSGWTALCRKFVVELKWVDRRAVGEDSWAIGAARRAVGVDKSASGVDYMADGWNRQ